ncbi:DNA polymerase III subunit delta [Sphingoaurantiacus capsulatus]|uniref:DNA-directed DNA polymerase n=1 Tax=Sphingoaurantiacus capsulatus TaxID=1771310 RepID=A0ABV7XE89_9SPHN
MKSLRADKGYAPERIGPDIRVTLFHGADEAASADLAWKLAKHYGGEIILLSPATLKEDPGRLPDEAAAVSMFGDKRVIRVDGAGDESVEAISLLLGATAAGNPAVIVAGNLRKGSKLLALIEDAPNAAGVISYEADARDAGRNLEEVAGEMGLQLMREVAPRLAAACNNDRRLIRRELEKLALYVDATPEAPQRLTVEHLAEVGAAVDDAEFGPLVDAVAGGRAAMADQQLTKLTAQGVAGIAQLRAVARRLWLLADLRTTVDNGMSPQAAVDGARPPVFWKEKERVTTQLQRWREPMLRNALERLFATERDIKKSGTAGDVLASQALLAIAAMGNR